MLENLGLKGAFAIAGEACGFFYVLYNLEETVKTFDKGVRFHVRQRYYLYSGAEFKKNNENNLEENIKNGFLNRLDYNLAKPGRNAGYFILKLGYSLIEMGSDNKRITRVMEGKHGNC